MPGIEWILLYLVLGALVGFLAGLLGLGGGGILVPLLASIFTYQGISGDNAIHLALGTSLACMIISSTASIRAHASRGTVVWQVVGGMAPGIILGAFLATQAAVHVNSAYIAMFFALFMALVAGQMFLNWQPKPNSKPATFLGLIAAGIGIGSVSALAAVGGGFLAVAYLGYKNVNIKSAIGTSAAIGFPIAITGTAGYMMSGWSITLSDPYTLGFIDVPAFLAIAITSSIAVSYGARCSHSLPEAYLKKIFAVISLLLSIKMLISLVHF
ncbi:sulfite exporter TauE/SafE family protein [Nitrosomonas sp.]|uniref:sulfite exporter TauE/SafE family protein n=1 Tax=Nitrosomonas sp. TaxID=42353 RepID=UPI0025DFA353|nr:sulfite exporter TauE/SafE family protein [Nitrosomonas sp.]MBY0483504.1 sulfite exporter TauE/SafE family protein [Nitrosomonas sp.]